MNSRTPHGCTNEGCPILRCSRRVSLFALAALALAFTACGGGGSSTPPDNTPKITSVTVTCASASVTTGATDQCSATVNGGGSFSTAVTWSASVGSISNGGLFTAPGTAGTATITATSVADPSKSGTATVTVTAPSPITGVSLTCPEPTLAQGLAEQCTATVQGTGTFVNTVTWSSSGGSIADGLFTAPKSSGDVTITAKSAADPTKSARKSVTITTPQKANFDYTGINHVSWWIDEYLSPNAAPSEAALTATGGNYAGVLVTQYQQTKTSTTIFPTNQTPSDAALVSAIQQLHSHGVKVMLKPHIDPQDGSWRGEFAPTDINAWFASYKTFIVNYATLAASNGVEMLCIGTEFKTLTGSAYLAQWTDIINSIRRVYTGKLTYAANATFAGDEFTSVSFWDQLDVLGLDGYFPLTNKSDPTIAELIAAWNHNANNQNIVSLVTNFAAAHPIKPVIFTEIGYRSAAGANKAPWDWSQTSTPDNLEQQNCYEAMYQVWSQQPGLPVKGHFWWAWDVTPPAVGDTGYNPRNKPAQTVLENWQ